MQLPNPNEGPIPFALNRRTRLRFDMNFPALLRTFGEPWKAVELKNASAKGAFFLTDTPLLLGAGVEYVLRLPPELTKADQPLMVRFLGTVVRCEASREKGLAFGVALTASHYEYVAAGDVCTFDALFEKTSAIAKG